MEAYGAEYTTCRLQFLYPLSKPLLLYLFAYLILPSKLLIAAHNVPTPRPPLSSTPDLSYMFGTRGNSGDVHLVVF